MKRFKSIVVAALVAVITISSVAPGLMVAAQSSASLSIVPKKNYTVEPGRTIKDTLTIRNLDSDAPLELSLRVVDFTYTDDGGTPKLMLAEDAPQTTWSLKPFLDVPETVTIPARSSKTLDMSVAIPANQGAGSYYSAIVYASGAPEGGNVGLSASGVTLVFTSVPGEVKEDLQLEKFGAYNVAKTGKEAGYTFLSTLKPETMAYTLKNNGNVTEAPVGTITLRHMFGQEIEIDNVNPNQSLALVGQTRTFTACIKLKAQEVEFNGTRAQSTQCAAPDLWPGIYTATINLYYGQNGNRTQEITGSATFIYLPLWFIIVLVVVLGFITYLVLRINSKIQSKRRGPRKRPAHRR